MHTTYYLFRLKRHVIGVIPEIIPACVKVHKNDLGLLSSVVDRFSSKRAWFLAA